MNDGLWFQQGRGRVIRQEDLEAKTPRPTADHSASQGHVLPYVSKGEENWHRIERVLRTGGRPNRVIMKCLVCHRGIMMIVRDPEMFDASVKFLCDDCRYDDGYSWASQLTKDQVQHYQMVKHVQEDVLMRRLDRSPNFKEAVHKPIDSVEEAIRSLTRKKP